MKQKREKFSSLKGVLSVLQALQTSTKVNGFTISKHHYSDGVWYNVWVCKDEDKSCGFYFYNFLTPEDWYATYKEILDFIA